MKKFVCIIALLCAVAVQADAQSWKDILNGVVGQVVGDKATTATSIIGTWSYVGPDCQLKGDDLLKNIGGDAAGVEVEKKMEPNDDYEIFSCSIENYCKRYKERLLNYH